MGGGGGRGGGLNEEEGGSAWMIKKHMSKNENNISKLLA